MFMGSQTHALSTNRYQLSYRHMRSSADGNVPHHGWRGDIAFNADPVGIHISVGIASCLHSVS